LRSGVWGLIFIPPPDARGKVPIGKKEKQSEPLEKKPVRTPEPSEPSPESAVWPANDRARQVPVPLDCLKFFWLEEAS
jgi:hypothetical protein